MALWALLAGCGPTLYTMHIGAARQAVHQADEAGAREHAPYEYFYADAHLKKALEEAGEASYQDAAENARIAEEYGVKARDLARRRMREAGR